MPLFPAKPLLEVVVVRLGLEGLEILRVRTRRGLNYFICNHLAIVHEITEFSGILNQENGCYHQLKQISTETCPGKSVIAGDYAMNGESCYETAVRVQGSQSGDHLAGSTWRMFLNSIDCNSIV